MRPLPCPQAHPAGTEREAASRFGLPRGGRRADWSSVERPRQPKVPAARLLAKGLLLPLFLCLLLAGATSVRAYSLLTHEEIIDILWKDQIQPLLLQRFPDATTAQLRQAHAYAYGGSLVHDMGYYPFGKQFFSDLTHYVRTGDFVSYLLREATNQNEYAFALGALSHYCSDTTGHPEINQAVAVVFPELRAKYGDSVTYEECPRAHIRTEFGFDLTQVAKHRYTSDRYHDWIGFEVAVPLLERAVWDTYGLRLDTVLGDEDLAIGSFRHAVSQVIPQMTRAALTAYHPELVKDNPTFNKTAFLYNLSRVQYEKEWGKHYRRPGFFARVCGFLVKCIPKFGPLGALAFQLPTPQTEEMYLQSVNRTVEAYRLRLRLLAQGNVQLPNLDCDTGRRTRPGEYDLADETYAQLLEELCKRGLVSVRPDLRQALLGFFAQAQPRSHSHKDLKAWFRTQRELEALRSGSQSPMAHHVRRELLAPAPMLRSPKALDEPDPPGSAAHPKLSRSVPDAS